MDLRHLEYFVAVAETGSFTGAADRLGVGQPAVSSAIRRLEDSLGAELLARTRQGVTLTAAGDALLPAARQTLAAAREARRRVEQVLLGERGTIRLGALDLTYRLGLTRTVADFRLRHPLAGIQLVHGGTGAAELIEKVRRGQLDAAVSAAVRRAPPGVAYRVLDSSAYRVHVAADHPRIRADRVAADALRDEPFVSFAVGTAERADTDHFLADLGIDPPVPIEVDRLETMFEVVRHGDAVALMPQKLAAVHPPGLRTVAIDRDDLPPCDVILATPTTRTLSPAVDELLDAVAGDLFGRAAA